MDPVSGEFFCSACGKMYSTTDMLNIVGAPVKPQPPPGKAPWTTKSGEVMKPLYGKTYEVKEELKQLGGRWNPLDRVWMIPESKFQQALNIVARGPQQNYGNFTSASTLNYGAQSSYYQTAYMGPSPGSYGNPNPVYGPGYRASRVPYADPIQEAKNAEVRKRAQWVSEGKARVCWECEAIFTPVEAGGGDWDEYWCGCLDKTAPKQVKAR